MRSQRQLRVGEAIRHALASVFQRGDAPWPKGFMPPMITITEVQISPDLRNATVFYLAMGDDRSEEIQRTLKEMTGFFRRGLAQTVKMRYVPELVFKPDASFEYASNIERILSDPAVAKDLRKETRETLQDGDEEI